MKIVCGNFFQMTGWSNGARSRQTVTPLWPHYRLSSMTVQLQASVSVTIVYFDIRLVLIFRAQTSDNRPEMIETRILYKREQVPLRWLMRNQENLSLVILAEKLPCKGQQVKSWLQMRMPVHLKISTLLGIATIFT